LCATPVFDFIVGVPEFEVALEVAPEAELATGFAAGSDA
jgi:hypothetical protein